MAASVSTQCSNERLGTVQTKRTRMKCKLVDTQCKHIHFLTQIRALWSVPLSSHRCTGLFYQIYLHLFACKIDPSVKRTENILHRSCCLSLNMNLLTICILLILLHTAHVSWTISSNQSCQHLESYIHSPTTCQYMHHHASHFSHANVNPTSFTSQTGNLLDVLFYADAQQTNILAVGMCYHTSICEAHKLM